MNPPMEDGERARVDDLVRRVERVAIEQREDRENLYKALSRAVDGMTASIQQLDARVTERLDQQGEGIDELRDGTARRKDLLYFAAPVTVAVIGIVGAAIGTGGGFG